MKKREISEIIFDIRNEIPEFNREELIQYTKWVIPKLYNSLKNEEKLEVKCKPELIEKLEKEKEKYRINKSMDQVSVQYVEIYDNIKKEDDMYIQVYSSIYFYDDVGNNVDKYSENDKYWNDIWIITFRKGIKLDRQDCNCANCGAVMKYNRLKDVFECEYCGNIVHNNSDSKWEIVDIELGM